MKNLRIKISISEQALALKEGGRNLAIYPVSTSKFGEGTQRGSFKTPTGKFCIAKKIGKNLPIFTFFRNRIPQETFPLPNEDAILSRILWLKGLEEENQNTYNRFIYIHGTNQEKEIGTKSSNGCIRMKNADILELFEKIPPQTLVQILP